MVDKPTVGVVGLGYVGLPLAEAIVKSGRKVVGIDSKHRTVDLLNRGISHIDDISGDRLCRMLADGFSASTTPEELSSVEVVVLCVPTPLASDGSPDLSALISAGRTVSTCLQPGQMVILESTTYPGTTEEVLVPILAESGLLPGVDFNVAFSPERIDPGNTVFHVGNTPKVVGGLTEDCRIRAQAFYEEFVEEVIGAKGLREAEMAKLLENTYRQINIALVNEMSRFCHLLEIDLWDAIKCAASKPFGFEPFFPGPGVGGHCIPIDPNYLAHRVRTRLGLPFRFVELAQEINGGMPTYVVDRAFRLLNSEGRALKGSRVLLLGVTYKANVSDERESPATAVAIGLLELGAEVAYADPYVETWSPNGTALPRVELAGVDSGDFDLVILLQGHSAFDLDSIARWAVPTLDTRGLMKGPTVQML